MNFREHLISATLLAAGLYYRRPLAAALLIAGGVLIDVDHLVLYAIRTGDWSISGALCYNRYRNRPLLRGDNRPRYGSLRSWLHQPLLILPPLWALAHRLPWLRPLAIGVSLHLALDYLAWPRAMAAYLRTGGRCAQCGQQRRVTSYLRPRQPDRRLVWMPLCPRCADRRLWYTEYEIPVPPIITPTPRQR